MPNSAFRTVVRFASSYSPADRELFGVENLNNIRNLIKNAKSIRPPPTVDNSSRKSAVLVPLIISNEKPAIIFTVRSNFLNTHRGQISFPGGSVEADDEGDFARAALRETNEEIGVNVTDVQVLGVLPSTLGRQSVVVPVVGLVNESVDVKNLQHDLNEVSEIFVVTLEHLCQPEHRGYTQFKSGYSLPVFISVDGYRIWGLTAIILHQILRILSPDYYMPKLKFVRPIV